MFAVYQKSLANGIVGSSWFFCFEGCGFGLLPGLRSTHMGDRLDKASVHRMLIPGRSDFPSPIGSGPQK
jgi:hypothetical protein